jgi:hypothetical protein
MAYPNGGDAPTPAPPIPPNPLTLYSTGSGHLVYPNPETGQNQVSTNYIAFVVNGVIQTVQPHVPPNYTYGISGSSYPVPH